MRELIKVTPTDGPAVSSYPHCATERAPGGRCVNGEHFDKHFIVQTVVTRLPVMENQFDEWQRARDERRRNAWEYIQKHPPTEEYDPCEISRMEKWVAFGTVAVCVIAVWYCLIHPQS